MAFWNDTRQNAMELTLPQSLVSPHVKLHPSEQLKASKGDFGKQFHQWAEKFEELILATQKMPRTWEPLFAMWHLFFRAGPMGVVHEEK